MAWAGFKLRQAWLGYHERELYRAFIKLSPWVARNLILPDGLGGRIHVDYLILTSCALHWVSVFMVRGSVFGSHNMAEWAVFDSDQRWTFPNPLVTFPHKTSAIHALIGDSVPLAMDLLFLDNPEFPKGRVEGVWLQTEYFEHLKAELNSG
ncbi:NERD domain protein, partial [mine drainage metagenome]